MRNTTLYTNKPKTFRRSSTQLINGVGSNLQNIEKSLRSIYIPDGYEDSLQGKCKYWLETGDLSVFSIEELETLRVFLQVDQSGAEALIVAYECEPKDYRELFKCGVKPHVYVALKLFTEQWKKESKENGLSLTDDDIDILAITPITKLKLNPQWRDLDNLIKASDDWSLSKRYYYFAKQTCHSGNYGIEWATFVMNVLEKSGGKVVIPKEDGIRFLQTYRGLFPEIPERCERIRHQVNKTGVLFNLFGHPYYITNENISERTYKEYYAWSAQSTVGEITRTAYCDLQEYIEDCHLKWDILIDCHDSYLVQCPLAEVKQCGNKMQEFMNIELTSPFDNIKFRMKSELKIGFNWNSYKKDENDLGLRELKW